MKIKKCAITTIDNPYDPFEQFSEWYMFDCIRGYNTCSYLARFAFPSDSLSDFRNDEIMEQAIDEILKHNPTGIYKKIEKEYEADDLPDFNPAPVPEDS